VLGDPQSLNLYTYVRNIPTTEIDLDGHCGNWFCQAVSETFKVQAGAAIGTAKFLWKTTGAAPAVSGIQQTVQAMRAGPAAVNASMYANMQATINTVRTANSAAMGNEQAAVQILTSANNAWNSMNTTDKASVGAQLFWTGATIAAGGGISGPAGAAAEIESIPEGQTLFRVWGGESSPFGHSWTSVNPESVANFRDAAGLPDVNTGAWTSVGTLTDNTGITTRSALPLDGNQGGLPEILVPNPQTQIEPRYTIRNDPPK
jgi:hypothetical protein